MGIRIFSVAFRWLNIGLLASLAPLISAARAQDVPPPLPVDPNAGSAGYSSATPADGYSNPAPAGGYSNPAPAEQSDPNVEVMTRGPVHEAYAVPLSAGQTTGVIVPKQPSAPIEEVPPDMKPEGNPTWIPGYWSWDDERRDFIWVSGVWRSAPPGYRWMPGYWQPAQGQEGFQRISGYWMPTRVQETTYLPQPPQSMEAGPNTVAPGQNYFWIPGHWQWYDTRYVWQPGYWAAYQTDWIWVPATYAWTPRGFVYVPGYWDYPLARRGLVFSPVYFAGPVAYYRPAICLDAGVFSVSLFCRPAYGHYYFGDYYDDRYVAFGIRPYFYYNSPRYGYDPLFSYYRWYHVDHMGEREWDRHLVAWHDYYRVHPDMRPPHTWAAQQALLASRAGMARPDIAQLRMVGDVHVVARTPGASMRFQAVSPAERAHIQEAARASVRSEAERRQVERQGAGGAGPRGAEKVSLASMPSYKSTQVAGAASTGRPAGA
ncbi:MAG: YXWGXW repeat-containing protein, partial [Thermoguttaceae bacterium]